MAMQLVSDDSKFSVNINGLEVVIAPENVPPFHVSAVVEEQDVALLLGENQAIHQDSDKPIWYLSHKLESQVLQTPGDVIVRHTNPLRLLAIVHDFDQEPSWQSEWVAQALVNIVHVVEKNRISSLRLPVLGAQYGRVNLQEFIQLFMLAFMECSTVCLKRIWLAVEQKNCQKAFSILQENTVKVSEEK